VSLGHVGWHVHNQAEVGRVTSGSQDTLTFNSLVKGALINVLEVDLGLNDRFEPHHHHSAVENLRVRFTEHTVYSIPLAAFQVHTVHMDTFWRSRHLFQVDNVVNNFEVHSHSIDRNLHLSGVILKSASQETVSEVELVNPEVLGDLSVKPGLEELNTFNQILDVTSERLERWVTSLHPHSRNLTI